MKLMSFNVNGIRARLHQLEAVLHEHQPDVIGLQEIKVRDEEFPVEAVEAMGYQIYRFGQKGHYGVALLSREPALSIAYGFPGDAEDAQRRMITGVFLAPNGDQVTVMNGYFPQGDSRAHPTKFPAKQKFYSDLAEYLREQLDPTENVVVMGDLNISAEDIDIGIGDDNRKRWLRAGKCSFLPEEREWLGVLRDWGLQDTYRCLNPNKDDCFSWFDYRSKGFDREPKRGLRIDAILATARLCQSATEVGIDYAARGMEKPSDHCPVWTEFDLK
ncbi:MAG: exodeoxyribonuclease III [Pseudomonadales bacterium]|nr:exodeoxyribonuclease III [Pseudomonadales bacterium]